MTGRGYAVLLQRRPAALADPVGGPGRREDGPDPDVAEARLTKSRGDVVADGVHRGAARVGRGDRHLDAAVVVDRDVTEHAQVLDGQHGDLGIGDAARDAPGAREEGLVRHDVTTWPPGASGAGAASPRAGSPSPRCGCRAGRRWGAAGRRAA